MILKKSEGNPFYVEEVIRMLIDRGKITRQDGHWAMTGEIQTLDIPDTLHGVLTARIDRLSDEAKFTLQVASVIGRKFTTEILSTVMRTVA
jgi:predicted ATPase